jgi:hypothetical protein
MHRAPRHKRTQAPESFGASPAAPRHPGDSPQRRYSPFPLCLIFAAERIAAWDGFFLPKYFL